MTRIKRAAARTANTILLANPIALVACSGLLLAAAITAAIVSL